MSTRSDYDELDELARPGNLFAPTFRWLGGGLAGAGAVAVLAWAEAGRLVLAEHVGGTLVLLGLAVAAFSQEPTEDELTRKLRLESSHMALIFGISFLTTGNLLVGAFGSFAFLSSGTVALGATLCFYLVRFHTALRSLRPSNAAET